VAIVKREPVHRCKGEKRRMKKSFWIGFIVIAAFSLFVMMPTAIADGESILFYSIKSLDNPASSGSSNLPIYSISGIRNTVYFAFNFSEFPMDASPQLAMFSIKTVAILDACNVDAFYFSSADWVNTNSAPNDSIVPIPIGASNFVLEGQEWYSYTSNSFIQAVKEACLNRSMFTVSLKARSNAYGDSTIVVYPNATLQVIYSLVSPTQQLTPSPSIQEFPPALVLSLLAVSTLVGTMLFGKKIKNGK
jgi:hypothetical protein